MTTNPTTGAENYNVVRGASGDFLMPRTDVIDEPFHKWLFAQFEALARMPMVGQLGVLERALELADAGTWVEFGVAGGASLRKMTAAAGAIAKPNWVSVWGFDTFTGLPEDWRPECRKGAFALEAIPIIEGAHLVSGRFEETLPDFAPVVPVTLAHIDCDLYSSAAAALGFLSRAAANGCLVVFDELLNYPSFERHEMRALYEASAAGLAFEWIAVHGGGAWYPNERAALRIRR